MGRYYFLREAFWFFKKNLTYKLGKAITQSFIYKNNNPSPITTPLTISTMTQKPMISLALSPAIAKAGNAQNG